MLASAVCIDKAAFKRLMAQAGMPQVRYEVDRGARVGADPTRGPALARALALGLPSFVKPARQGSSVGISKVISAAEELEGCDRCRRSSTTLSCLVEAAAVGQEIECSVIGNDEPTVSEPGEVLTTGAEWYDYKAKYNAGGMELVVPAPISAAQRERVRRIAADAYARSGCAGLARVDFFVTA